MKPISKVICVANQKEHVNLNRMITIGEVYDVYGIDDDNNCYLILDDLNAHNEDHCWHEKDFFITLEEHRNEILKQILTK